MDASDTCRLVGVDPKTVRCEPTPDHPEVRARMRVIASKRRRICLMLKREGITTNHKMQRRLYCEEGLSVRGRKRATGTKQLALRRLNCSQMIWCRSRSASEGNFGGGRKADQHGDERRTPGCGGVAVSFRDAG